MNKVQAGRMLTVTHFLETQVPRKEYDQSMFVKGDYARLATEHVCRSAACALGYTALLYPNHWQFASYGAPLLINTDDTAGSIFKDAATFFGISKDEALEVFGAPEQCSHTGTPKSVAKAMLKLVAKYGWEDAGE